MSIAFETGVVKRGGGPSPFGDRGDDTWTFQIPAGEEYDRSDLEVYWFGPASDARIASQPEQGRSGELSVEIHWWYEGLPPFAAGEAAVAYKLTVFSRQATLVGEPGRIFLFEDVNFEGRVKEVVNGSADLTFDDDRFFNDCISSFVIVKGNWMFFKDIRFVAPYLFEGQALVVEPGMYPDVRALDIANDDLSSLLCVAARPNHR